MVYLRQELARRKRVRRGAIALAAMLALALLSAGGYGIFRLPVSYISIDVNPSVELALNCLDRVVDATGYNEDGAVLLQSVQLRGKRYQKAIELLLEAPALEKVLDEDALVSFTVVSDREEQLLSGIQNCQGYGAYDSECHAGNQTLLEEAHGCHMSVGKYRASLELMELDQSLTLEDCQAMTMGEIRRRLTAGTELPCTEVPSTSPAETTVNPEQFDCDSSAGTGHGASNGNGQGQSNGFGNGQGNGFGNGQGNGFGNGQGNGQGQGNSQGHGGNRRNGHNG